MTADSEHRARSRVDAKLPVLLGIVFPQDTFTPYFEETFAHNLSIGGSMISVTLPDAILKKALEEPHYCRIQFTQEGLPTRIIGRVVWTKRTMNRYEYNVGVAFTQLGHADQGRLDRYVESALYFATRLRTPNVETPVPPTDVAI